MVGILIVEDDTSQAESLANLLDRRGFKTKVANNAEDGLNALKDHNIEGIISDYNLPGMNGYEFLRIVRSDNKCSHIKMIIGIGDFSGDQKECLNVCYSKPLSREKFGEMIGHLNSLKQ